MDSFRQIQTAGRGLLDTIAYDLDTQPEPDKPLKPSSFLPNFPILDDPFFGNILNKVLGWLRIYGEVCSVVVATLLLVRMLLWVMGMVLRLSTISMSANPFMHILWACCPAIHGFVEAPARWCQNLACCKVEERPDSLRRGHRSGIYRPNEAQEDEVVRTALVSKTRATETRQEEPPTEASRPGSPAPPPPPAPPAYPDSIATAPSRYDCRYHYHTTQPPGTAPTTSRQRGHRIHLPRDWDNSKNR